MLPFLFSASPVPAGNTCKPATQGLCTIFPQFALAGKTDKSVPKSKNANCKA